MFLVEAEVKMDINELELYWILLSILSRCYRIPFIASSEKLSRLARMFVL